MLKSKCIYRITLICNLMRAEQGLLKATILKCLDKSGEMNSQEIFDYIRKVPYSYHSNAVTHENILYTGSIEALRVELVYLRKHGFISKTNKTRLLNYALTKLGKQAVDAPFRFTEIFDEHVQAEVEKRMNDANQGINLPEVIEKPDANIPIIGGRPDRYEKIEEQSILFIGSDNEVGINVSDDPTKGKFVTLTVVNGVPALS